MPCTAYMSLTGYFLGVRRHRKRLPVNCSRIRANYFRFLVGRVPQLIDEFVGRVSATLQHHLPTRYLTGIDPCISRSRRRAHSKFHPTHEVKFTRRGGKEDKNIPRSFVRKYFAFPCRFKIIFVRADYNLKCRSDRL